MKKLFLLTKTLLVAVMLLAGTNAWADDEYTTVYTRAAVANWANDDVTDWGNAALTHDENHGLYFNAETDNGSFSATKSFTSIKANSKIKYEVTWVVGGATSGTANYLYVQLGDKLCFGYNNNYKVYLSQDGGTTYGEKEYSAKNSSVATHNIEVIFDTSTGEVEKLTYDATDITEDIDGVLTGNFNSVTFGFVKSGTRTTYGKTSGLDKLIVSECEQVVSTADYTINYKYNDETIKTVNGTSVIGTTINATSPITISDNKYYAADGATTSMVLVDGINTLNVNLRAANTYTCTVNAKVGDVALGSSSETVVEGESKKVFYKKAYLNGGVWYVTPANGSYPWYAHSFSSVTADDSYNVSTYVANNNIVYFGEVEEMNLSGSFAANGGQTDRYSNGVAKRLYSAGGATPSSRSYVYTGNLAAGVYTVTMWARNQSSSQTATLPVKLRDSEGNITDLSTSFDAWGTSAQGEKSVEVTIPNDGKTYSIAIDNYTGYNSNLEMDYVYVTLVRPATVSKTIDATLGWGTYCSPYALDFSSSIANLTKAYLVTGGADGKLTLSPITTTIPASTGILLEGSGEVNIPVAASSSTDVSSNKLVGVTSETSGVAAGIYVLLYGADDTTGPVGFYKTTNAFTVGANTAYLPANFTGGGAREAYLFGGVTGINEAAASSVAAEKDGKFVINGQLVIKKNGKKFNANGTQMK